MNINEILKESINPVSPMIDEYKDGTKFIKFNSKRSDVDHISIKVDPGYDDYAGPYAMTTVTVVYSNKTMLLTAVDNLNVATLKIMTRELPAHIVEVLMQVNFLT